MSDTIYTQIVKNCRMCGEKFESSYLQNIHVYHTCPCYPTSTANPRLLPMPDWPSSSIKDWTSGQKHHNYDIQYKLQGTHILCVPSGISHLASYPVCTKA